MESSKEPSQRPAAARPQVRFSAPRQVRQMSVRPAQKTEQKPEPKTAQEPVRKAEPRIVQKIASKAAQGTAQPSGQARVAPEQQARQSSQQGAAGNAITQLIQLEHAARKAENLTELDFTIANETARLFHYRQCGLYNARANRIDAVSGTPQADVHTPYMQWLKQLCKYCFSQMPKPQRVSPEDLPEEIGKQWKEWFAPFALWVPLRIRGHELGGFIMCRSREWQDPELTLAGLLGEAYAHAMLLLMRARPVVSRSRRQKIIRAAVGLVAIALVGAMFIPVPMTALGQMEVRSEDLTVMRSPLDGTVESVLVEPNSAVQKGTVLARLDVQDLSNRLRMAQKSRDTEQARMQQAVHRALNDPRYAAQATIARATLAEQEAEVKYLQEMIERAQIRAPFDGVAVFDSRQDLLGKPLHTGERLMDLAHPDGAELRVWLSTEDAMPLKDGAKIKVFLNTDPDRAIDAHLVRSGFVAVPRPEGFMAYGLDARFDDATEQARIGVRGVAKIYGEQVPLWFYLFRRPVTSVRQFFGF